MLLSHYSRRTRSRSTNRLGTFNSATQSYTYDGFGNIQSITTKPVGTTTETTRLTPTSAATNRLMGAGTTYDGRGNLASWNGAAYRWGALDMMWRMTSGAEDWVYVYTAADERLFGFQVAGAGQVNRFTLRDLGGQVLREYIQDRAQGYAWHVERDYVYRDGALLAAKLENIFERNLTEATARAAGVESRGGVVALKATGEAFDHVRKFQEARRGVTKALDALKGLLGNPDLADRDRAFVQYLVSKFSQELDRVERILEKAAQGFIPPPL
jgi:YD repeat-containing protein